MDRHAIEVQVRIYAADVIEVDSTALNVVEDPGDDGVISRTLNAEHADHEFIGHGHQLPP
jgi:hypothetical protein